MNSKSENETIVYFEWREKKIRNVGKNFESNGCLYKFYIAFVARVCVCVCWLGKINNFIARIRTFEHIWNQTIAAYWKFIFHFKSQVITHRDSIVFNRREVSE